MEGYKLNRTRDKLFALREKLKSDDISDEEKVKIREKLEKIKNIRDKRKEKIEVVKNEAAEKLTKLSKERKMKLYEAALESLKFGGFISGALLSAGWATGAGATAAVGVGGARTLSMVLNPFVKSKLESGSFVKDVKKSLEEGLDKTASFFKPGIS